MMRAAGVFAALALLACSAQAAIDIVDDRGRHIVLDAPAQRVITLSPSLTETVCALGACTRLVGVDRYSNWPAGVKALPQLGGLEDTAIERVLSLKPDVVLAASSARAIDRLEALGIKVAALEPKSLQSTRRVLDIVAQLLGQPSAGPLRWQQMQTRIDAAAARVPPGLRGQTVYLEVAGAPYAASPTSFVGELLTRLGMANAVPGDLGPFPKLNPEFVVRAQPDVMMATERSIAEMPARPGWSSLRALQRGKTCGFNAPAWDPLVRAGPRLADAAETLADCLVSLPKD